MEIFRLPPLAFGATNLPEFDYQCKAKFFLIKLIKSDNTFFKIKKNGFSLLNFNQITPNAYHKDIRSFAAFLVAATKRLSQVYPLDVVSSLSNTLLDFQINRHRLIVKITTLPIWYPYDTQKISRWYPEDTPSGVWWDEWKPSWVINWHNLSSKI